jgi:hypothetical protein
MKLLSRGEHLKLRRLKNLPSILVSDIDEGLKQRICLKLHGEVRAQLRLQQAVWVVRLKNVFRTLAYDTDNKLKQQIRQRLHVKLRDQPGLQKAVRIVGQKNLNRILDAKLNAKPGLRIRQQASPIGQIGLRISLQLNHRRILSQTLTQKDLV